MEVKKAIVIGASSGIGKELATVFSHHGYEVGLTARRENLLKGLQGALFTKSYLKPMDILQLENAMQALRELLAEMKNVELIVINAGISTKSKATWEQERQIIGTNVTGFVAMANVAMDYFSERGGGHIVGISSVAALKGFGISASYSSSKAFISTYMQALRQKSKKLKLNITISDIKPGFIETPMISGRKNLFWVTPADRAARQIYSVIQKKKNHAYIPGRWRLAAWLLKALPDWLFIRLPV
jgi:short-subunit dehydrogenase